MTAQNYKIALHSPLTSYRPFTKIRPQGGDIAHFGKPWSRKLLTHFNPVNDNAATDLGANPLRFQIRKRVNSNYDLKLTMSKNWLSFDDLVVSIYSTDPQINSSVRKCLITFG